MFLVERHWKVFARLALYVVIVLPDGGPLEEVMPLMQRLEHVKLGADADADASRFVLERALDLKVTRAMLDALGDEFESLTAPAAPASPPPSSPPAPRRVSKPPPRRARRAAGASRPARTRRFPVRPRGETSAAVAGPSFGAAVAAAFHRRPCAYGRRPPHNNPYARMAPRNPF